MPSYDELFPPPERPPNVGSKEREEWEDSIGEAEARRRKLAWQKWIQDKDAWVERNLVEQVVRGVDPEQAAANIGIFNEHERDQSYYRDWIEGGKLDDTLKGWAEGMYGGGNPNVTAEHGWVQYGNLYFDGQNWYDANGRLANPSAQQRAAASQTYNSQLRNAYSTVGWDPNMVGASGAYGGALNSPNLSAGSGNGTRPLKKTPNDTYWRGWAAQYGVKTSPTTKQPVLSENPYGDLRTGGVTGIPAEFQNELPYGYIPGLSPQR